jgi:hypothetical protein
MGDDIGGLFFGWCSEQVDHWGAASYPTTVGRFSVDLRAVPTLVGPDQVGPTLPQFTGLGEILVPFTLVTSPVSGSMAMCAL